jgi:hypothetical protein
MATSIDRRQVDRWLTQGLSLREIARRLEIPWATFRRHWHQLQQKTSLPVDAQEPTQAHPGTPAADHTRHTQAHPSTPARRQRHTVAHLGTPATHPTQVHPGTPQPRGRHPTRVHRGTPAEQPTQVHQGTPLPPELVRMLSLLPDLEAMVARERDRQRLLSTPTGGRVTSTRPCRCQFCGIILGVPYA